MSNHGDSIPIRLNSGGRRGRSQGVGSSWPAKCRRVFSRPLQGDGVRLNRRLSATEL